MRQKTVFISSFIVFLVLAFLFCFFTQRIDFHDAPQYINVAKEFAGISIAPVFTGHASLYPAFISLFLKFFPHYLTIKLINMSWLILTGLILYFLTRDVKSFLLWMFSPIVWYTSIITTPLVIVSFSLISAYLFLMRWEKSHKKIYFIFSGLSLGLGMAVWSGTLLFAVFFLLSFFWKKKLKRLFYYCIFTLPFVIFRLIFDNIIFGFPFYSYIRAFGTVIARRMGATSSDISLRSAGDNFIFRDGFIMLRDIIFLISPLALFLYKIDYKKYSRELVFILLSILFIVYYHVSFYPILIAPFIIFLLSKVLSKKQVIISILISIIIIPFLTCSYFHEPREVVLAEDLYNIYNDFGYEKMIAGDVIGSFGTAILNAAYWYDEGPELFWASDYKLFLDDNTDTSSYSIMTEPKINTIRILEISAKVRRNTENDEEFEGLPLLAYDNEEYTIENIPEGFEKVRCYRKICVYEHL